MSTLVNVNNKYLRNTDLFLDKIESLHDKPSINFLVSDLTGIGDTLECLPVIRTIQDRWPGSWGGFIVQGGYQYAELFRHESFELFEIEKGKGLANVYRQAKQLKNMIPPGLDLFVNLDDGPRCLYFQKLLGAELNLGFKSKRNVAHRFVQDGAVDRCYTKFLADTFLDVIRLIGLDRHHADPSFSPPESARPEYESWRDDPGVDRDEPYWLIFPGASGEGKRWPVEHWIDMLAEFGESYSEPLVILEGPAEPGLADEIKNGLPSRLQGKIEVARDLPLTVVTHLVKNALGLFTNDTSLYHLGITLGTPTICIFVGKEPYEYLIKQDHVWGIYDLETQLPEPAYVLEESINWLQKQSIGEFT